MSSKKLCCFDSLKIQGHAPRQGFVLKRGKKPHAVGGLARAARKSLIGHPSAGMVCFRMGAWTRPIAKSDPANVARLRILRENRCV